MLHTRSTKGHPHSPLLTQPAPAHRLYKRGHRAGEHRERGRPGKGRRAPLQRVREPEPGRGVQHAFLPQRETPSGSVWAHSQEQGEKCSALHCPRRITQLASVFKVGHSPDLALDHRRLEQQADQHPRTRPVWPCGKAKRSRDRSAAIPCPCYTALRTALMKAHCLPMLVVGQSSQRRTESHRVQ